jgi:acetate kinase
LSYEYIASVLPAHDSRAAAGRTIVLHLGNGASMCAIAAGRSIATTMGFTAVDGLPMGTRSGSLDPGVVLYLMDECKIGRTRDRDAALSTLGVAWRLRVV